MQQKNCRARPASPGSGAGLRQALRLSVVSALLLVLSSAAGAQTVPPGVIVFSHEDSGSSDPTMRFSNLWSLNPQNPGQQTPITTFTTPPVFTATPVWRKDFSQLAFNSNFNDGLYSLEAASIYGINPDGSNLSQITGFGVLNPLPPPTGTVIGRVQAPTTLAGSGDVSGCVITVQGAPQNVPCLDGATFTITGVPVGSNWVRVQAQVSYPLTLGQPGLSLGSAPIRVVADAVTDAGTIVVYPQIPKSIEPAWSRDGSQLLVTNEVSVQVLRRNPTSGQLEWVPGVTHQLNVWSANGQFVGAIPNAPGFEFIGSDWSPAADQICFAANGSSAGQSFVVVANPDGSNPRNVYQVPIDFSALHLVTFCRWSPDGRRIAFIQSNGISSSDLYLVNADGTGLRQLTANQPGRFLLVPTWSPDSQAIAFQFSVGSNPLSFTSSNLWVIGADGTCCVQLTTDGRSTSPTWGSPTSRTRALSVVRGGSGSGTVTSVPPGITCGSSCSAQFVNGTSVVLTATPDTTSTFASWRGCDTVQGGECAVALTSAKIVTATFQPVSASVRLTIAKAGTGSGVVTSPTGFSCGGICTQVLNKGTMLTLTAAPDPGSTFTGWSGGACNGAGSCTVTLTADSVVTATFTAPAGQFALAVTLRGSGAGTVMSNPSGITCGTSCAQLYASGTTVTLTASAGPGASFKGWVGGGCGGTSACTVAMTAMHSVSGIFSAVFTDPDPTVATSIIRAVDIMELRSAVNTLRAQNIGLASFAFADPMIGVGSTVVKAMHFTDLRTAVVDACVQAGVTLPTYTDSTLTPDLAVIRAIDLNELRSALRTLE